MREAIKKNSLTLITALTGLLAGYLYWRFIGCSSGNCPITSNPYATTFMGGLAGYLIGDSIKDFRKKNQANEKPVE